MLQPRVCKLQLKILHAAIKTWCREINIFLLKKKPLSGLPGCPEARTPCSQCSGGVGGRGPGFDPWSGDSVPYATPKSFHAANKAQHSQTKFFFFFFFFFFFSQKREAAAPFQSPANARSPLCCSVHIAGPTCLPDSKCGRRCLCTVHPIPAAPLHGHLLLTSISQVCRCRQV